MKSVKAQSRNLHDLETRCYAVVRGALRKDEFKKNGDVIPSMSQGERSEGDRARDRRGPKGGTEPSSHCAPLSAGRSRQFNQP